MEKRQQNSISLVQMLSSAIEDKQFPLIGALRGQIQEVNNSHEHSEQSLLTIHGRQDVLKVTQTDGLPRGSGPRCRGLGCSCRGCLGG